jgi:hypothetical protein
MRQNLQRFQKLEAFLVSQWRHIGIYVFATFAYIPIELRKISDYIWVDRVSPLSSARAFAIPTQIRRSFNFSAEE